ncbi:MAG: radical SAM protein [Tissierellia bacterium]|nr:radical SAM protein [Tissierellia bacterium]
MIKKKYIIPIFIPHIGCPVDCIFCNQKKIAREKAPTEEEIRQDIRRYLSYFPNNYADEIAFYGGSFTGIPKEQRKRYLEIANEFIEEGHIGSIRCSTRPDYIREDVLDDVLKYPLKTIELGVQSTNNEVLKKNHRGHTVEAVENAVSLLQKSKIKLGLQMMTGLYGAKPGDDIQTAKDFIRWKADFVRIYPTVIIKDTLLEKYYEKGKYNPRSLEDSINIDGDIYRLFYAHDIPMIRIGLQSSEDIQPSLVGGPYHPSYRQLVESKIIDDFFGPKIKEMPKGKLEITAPRVFFDGLIGFKGENKKKWKRAFPKKQLSFRQGEHFAIETENSRYQFSTKEVMACD